MRLWVLGRRGGVWLDSSVVLFEALGSRPGHWPGVLTDGADELRCFAFDHDHPDTIENWALAAPVGSAFVNDWFVAFDRAVRVGLDRYIKHLRTRLPVMPWLPGGDASLPYLTMHALGTLLIQQRPGVRIRRWFACDGPLMVQTRADWNVRRIAWRVLTDPGTPGLSKSSSRHSVNRCITAFHSSNCDGWRVGCAMWPSGVAGFVAMRAFWCSCGQQRGHTIGWCLPCW